MNSISSSSSTKNKIDKISSTHSDILISKNSYQTESSIIIAAQTIYYLMLFSASEVSDTSYFNESDIMWFLDRFKLLDENHDMKNTALIRKLPEYYESEIQEKIKMQKEFIINDWNQLWHWL